MQGWTGWGVVLMLGCGVLPGAALGQSGTVGQAGPLRMSAIDAAVCSAGNRSVTLRVLLENIGRQPIEIVRPAAERSAITDNAGNSFDSLRPAGLPACANTFSQCLNMAQQRDLNGMILGPGESSTVTITERVPGRVGDRGSLSLPLMVRSLAAAPGAAPPRFQLVNPGIPQFQITPC